MKTITEAEFLRDVALRHELNVRHDQGVYRDLVLRDPNNSCMWFGITTWPGHLCYYGDMGTFVFTRTRDMFTFFRGRHDGSLQPNFGYWSEKIVATDKTDGHEEFSPDLFRAALEEHITDWIDCAAGGDYFDTFAELQQYEEELRASVESEILFVLDEYRSKDRALQAAYDFRFAKYDVVFNVIDFSDTKLETFTGRFAWACYAIQWAIKQYDAVTSPAINQQESA